MIFNTSDDIRKDVKNRISHYLKESVGQNTSIDTNNIISLLRSYFYELKIRDEVTDFGVSDFKDGYIVTIQYSRLNDDVSFDVDLFSELRKLKIVKIQEHENKNNLDKYFTVN
jgi:hypothetical protein